MRFALFVLLLGISGVAQAENLPVKALTPGLAATSSRDEVCGPAAGRPAMEVPAKLRYRVLINYGLGGYERAGFCGGPHGCVIDRLVSEELGGGNDIRNLWPLPNDGPWNAADKQRLAAELHARVCAGTLPLAEAQAMLAGDWIAAYRAMFRDQVAGADTTPTRLAPAP